MKKIVLLFLVFCSLSALGQKKLNIEIDNPAPRVGQRVNFYIKADFLADYFKEEFGDKVDFTGVNSVFGTQLDNIGSEIIFNEAKRYQIGPFNFEFNGVKYTTNSIEVIVIPKLPMKDGLWLRHTVFEGQNYLILEQLIRNESPKSDNVNSENSFTIGGVKPEEKGFTELKENLTKGIKLSNYSTFTNTLVPENAGLFDVGFSYSIKQYKVEFDENYNGYYLISEVDFIDLPKVFDIGRIELKK